MNKSITVLTIGRTLAVLSFFIIPLFALAQPQNDRHRRFDPQEFQRHMEFSITQEAGFTAEEAQAFFTPYNEMRQKQREMMNQIRELKCSIKSDASAKDYTNVITRIKELQVDMAELEQNCFKRLCKNVEPSKVFRAMQSIDNFHRKMVRRK